MRRLPTSDKYIWPKALAKIAILIVIGFFWFSYVGRNWAQFQEVQIQVAWAWIPASGLAFLLGYLLLAVLWRPILSEFTGIQLTYAQAFRASALSWLWRYVPGKIWTVASKAYLSIQRKEQAVTVGITATVETIWSQGTGLLLAAFFFAFFMRETTPFDSFRGLAFAMPLALLVAIHPKISFAALNVVLKLLHQPPVNCVPHYGRLLLITLAYLIVFLLWACGFVLFVKALQPIDLDSIVPLVALFCAAWSIGVFALFAPAGLGVRDSLLAWGLADILGYDAPIVVGVVAGSRLMTTLAELICFLAALSIHKSRHPSLQTKPNDEKGKVV